MKKIIFILGLAAVVLGTSCSDVLDLNPADRFSPATVWSTTTTADKYVIGLYSIFGANTEMRGGDAYASPRLSDAYSDILKSTSWNQYNHNFNATLLQETAFNSNSAGAFECWSSHYDRIRRENEFLRDAAEFGRKFGEDWLKIRIAEVRFCRAYAYFMLCRVYGGVILRTEVDGPEQNDKARSTEEECWGFIINELKELAPDLPLKWDSDNSGRATQKAAYGLLSRVALYAEKWDVAAQAARDCATAEGNLDLSKNGYAKIFELGINSPEVLFAVEFKSSVIDHAYDAYVRPSGDTKELGKQVYSGFVPTSELVDSYEMAGDGGNFSWEKHGKDPYANREPRFYATILYNGADWMGRKIESFVGGKDGYKAYENAGAAGTTVTGYYLRKYLIDGDKT